LVRKEGGVEAIRIAVLPSGGTTIGRTNSACSIQGVVVSPVTAAATWAIASIPNTAGNSRLPSNRWSSR
jgi:hypothetical protein